ncbi:hypothetical protein B0H14DRAFT_3770142 [Mycena olivaceomarginata]|nr:hypothetical protein B0H14DRAFT_3770142 [Mycena olivaceomarginata]
MLYWINTTTGAQKLSNSTWSRRPPHIEFNAYTRESFGVGGGGGILGEMRRIEAVAQVWAGVEACGFGDGDVQIGDSDVRCALNMLGGVSVMLTSPGVGFGSLGKSGSTSDGPGRHFDNMSTSQIKAQTIETARTQIASAHDYEVKGDLKNALAAYTKGGSLVRAALDSTEYKRESAGGVVHKEFLGFQKDNAARAGWSSENQAKLQASRNQVLIEHQPAFRSNGLALRQGSLPRGKNECQFPPVIVNDDPSVDCDWRNGKAPSDCETGTQNFAILGEEPMVWPAGVCPRSTASLKIAICRQARQDPVLLRSTASALPGPSSDENQTSKRQRTTRDSVVNTEFTTNHLKPSDRRSGRSRETRFLRYLFGDHVQLGEQRTSKREFIYLDVLLELANLMEAVQDGERAAFEEVAQHCIVRERAMEGHLVDGRHLEP